MHDPRVLRAIAHPVRNRMLSELAATGTLRAADVARELGIPANQASFHLRQLAKYGLVEEAPEEARDKRDRVWRVADERGVRLNLRELADSPGGGGRGLGVRADRHRQGLPDDRARLRHRRRRGGAAHGHRRVAAADPRGGRRAGRRDRRADPGLGTPYPRGAPGGAPDLPALPGPPAAPGRRGRGRAGVRAGSPRLGACPPDSVPPTPAPSPRPAPASPPGRVPPPTCGC